MSLSKYLLIGLGVGAIGGLVWLARDPDTTKFDPKTHTLAKLLDILDDTYLEYSCAYIFFYNILQNMKEQGQLTPDTLESVKVRISEYTKERDKTIAKRFSVQPELLEAWTRNYKEDKQVAKILADIQDLHEQVVVKMSLKEMHFGIPETFTREAYLQIARKVQACLRHEAYNQVQALLREKGKDAATNEEMDAILDKIGFEKQEQYRIEAMKLFGVEIPKGEVPKRFLQKAYLQFSTQSTVKSSASEPNPRSHWQHQI